MACNKVCVAVAIFATCCLWSHLCGPAEAAAVVSATEHSGVKIDDDNFDSKSSNDCAGGGSKNCAKSNSDSDVVVNNSNSNSDSYLGSSVADSFFSSELIEEGLSGFINKNRTARLEEEISQLWSSAVAEFTGDNTIEEGNEGPEIPRRRTPDCGPDLGFRQFTKLWTNNFFSFSRIESY